MTEDQPDTTDDGETDDTSGVGTSGNETEAGHGDETGETRDEERPSGDETENGAGPREELRDAAERFSETASAAADEFDQRLVDLLSWVLDTETRARIFVYLRKSPGATSEEVADGTGLYPSTVREALAELHDDGFVTRSKRASTGAGNNPYEYEAIPPSDLVEDVVDDVQSELNTVFNLDERLKRGDDSETTEPVQITVEVGAAERDGGDDGGESGAEETAESGPEETADGDSGADTGASGDTDETAE
jgi:predicted transcriptional regulator